MLIDELTESRVWLRPGMLRGSYSDQALAALGFRRDARGNWYIDRARWEELIRSGQLTEHTDQAWLAQDSFIDVDIDAMHAEALREHLLTDPAIFESREDFAHMREFLTLHATQTPRINDNYVYASVMTTPMANHINLAYFDREHLLVKLDSDYAYFEINGAIKRFPESGRLTGDSMSEIYFFNSTKEFRHFDHLLTLKFSGYKKSTKILDQPDLEENFADGVAEGFESETTLEKKLYILRKLQQMPLTVFGSVATKELSQANDFDVFFDLDSNPEYKKHITPIMELARNYYGWIDPFVLEDNVLYVRNDEATGWVRAKNAKEILKNVKLHGVPISQIQPDLAENFADGRVKDLRRKNKSPDNRIVAAITKAVPNAQEIWFHGSRAIGKHRPNSDIDILVVVPEELSAHDYIDTVDVLHQISKNFSNYDIQPTKPGYNIHRIAQEEGKLLWSNVKENFADGQVKGRSRPGRVRRAGASCKGSVTDLRARARKSGGEKGKMYRWCLNMKAGKKR